MFNKKLNSLILVITPILLCIGLLATLIITTPKTKYIVEDFLSDFSSTESYCKRNKNGGPGLLNIANEDLTSKDYKTAEEAINNYPWDTQYLPVGDIYCNLPLNIQSISLLGEPETTNSISKYKVLIKEGMPFNSEYNAEIVVEFDSQNQTYKVQEVRFNRA